MIVHPGQIMLLGTSPHMVVKSSGNLPKAAFEIQLRKLQTAGMKGPENKKKNIGVDLW